MIQSPHPLRSCLTLSVLLMVLLLFRSSKGGVLMREPGLTCNSYSASLPLLLGIGLMLAKNTQTTDIVGALHGGSA